MTVRCRMTIPFCSAKHCLGGGAATVSLRESSPNVVSDSFPSSLSVSKTVVLVAGVAVDVDFRGTAPKTLAAAAPELGPGRSISEV